MKEQKPMTQEELMDKFCTNVKAVCKAKGLATGVLELKAGMSRGYFSKLNKATKEVGLYTAYRIANTIGCDLKELLEDDMWRKTRIAELEAELKALKEGDQRKDDQDDL